MKKKVVFVINGSASNPSSNQSLIDYITSQSTEWMDVKNCGDLKGFPHFNPDQTYENRPLEITKLLENIQNADAVLICSPEYIFSIPSGLKNILEWCVSSTVFSEKITGVITASAQGEKGHEELSHILKTLTASLSPNTSLLIQGIKAKVNLTGEIVDAKTKAEVNKFMEDFKTQLIT